MFYGGRKSLLWHHALSFADRLRRVCFSCALLTVCRNLYARIERCGSRPTQPLPSAPGYDRNGWSYRLRHSGMRSWEQSLVIRGMTVVRDRLFRCRAWEIGTVLLLCGIGCTCMTRYRPTFDSDSGQWIASLGLIAASLPFLASAERLSTIAERSRWMRLCSCGAGEEPPSVPTEATVQKNGTVSLLTAAVGGMFVLCFCLAAWLFSPLYCCCGSLGVLLLGRLFAVPEWNLILLVFAFPFLQLLPHPTVVLGIAVLVADLSWGLKLFCGRRLLRLEVVDQLVLLFCGLLAFGGLVGWGNMRDGFCACVLASVYFPTKSLFGHARWRRRLRSASLTATFFCSGYGIIQYFWLDSELKWVDAARFSDIGSRVIGLFQNPNVLAIYLLFQLPMALCGCFDRAESAKKRMWFAGVTVMICLCMILTWSRGAWLGMLLELFLFFAFHSRSTLAVGCLALPFALLGCFCLPGNVFRRFASIGRLGDSSIRYRLYTWRGVLRMLSEHPFGIGVGTEAFFAVYPQYALSGIETVMHAHQIFLQIAVELGVLGLIVFLMLFGVICLRCAVYGHRMGSLYALCGVLLMGMFDHLWYCTGMICLFFITCACAVVGEEERV